ncbi:S8 family peptidase [Streptomyces cyaneofuscatus]|uniref:S8 family serine peptidase n=1 Tax=Streptomyces cyaneofuscatus TaxID=66883 RepID=A0ABZ1F0N6_9ACTN|nr:S8 family serine peptidase [Streptomyces cyaneofuscatus]WSB09902.1 S8 family serine peptidase [Streptomyces cyaneofuscatus]WSD46565.1 S8 family serine peptidase [Streptomyces cyaneofuscatus]WTA89941.1 S8 family serine peptidase [Streptomyces cyaneofuscatus]
MKRAGVPAVAAAAAVALAAGMTTPAAAQPFAPGAVAKAAAGSTSKVSHQLTLITGDRVSVDAKGRVVGFQPAEGRAGIPVHKQIRDGRTLVIPADAQRLIASGKLDRRLFDITELSRPENRRAQKKDLRLIVSYRGAQSAQAKAKAEVRDAGSTRIGRSLTSLNAQSVATPKADAPDLWQALTSEQADGAQRTTATGIDRVWLDGRRKATLDRSVAQIGAPTAWKAGYTGKGVKIAVLDTGVDGTHVDLKGKIVAAKNFTKSPDLKDRIGHGTHVASTAAGSGAKSGGKFKGVAPDAKLLAGKVLGDDGFGDDSGILAGMEWAVAQGADVVNLSLGGMDTPEVDALEAAVNKLSATKGVLFAIAAGNEGSGAGTVGSPGSAEAALTVGAVDVNDKLAGFSSRGPRAGDGGIKPDVTAPGVAITAASAKGSEIAKEVGESPAGYLTIDGTSMATPHVAGAAALLKQQHPEWTYKQLKNVLASSTKPGKYTPFQQGTGRIAVDRALTQTVVSEQVSVNLGVQQWPHTDDVPVSKQVTYRNLGTTDVTLDLTVAGTGPKGKPAPAGFFTLGAPQVTVPAGGTAAVALTADTRLGGAEVGAYSAYVVATGGGQSVRTAAVVDRERESYDVTLKAISRTGKVPTAADAELSGLGGSADGASYSSGFKNGVAKVRVPKGTFVLNGAVITDPKKKWDVDWLVQPKLTVTKNTTITLDARKTKPAAITLPVKGTKLRGIQTEYTLATKEYETTYGWAVGSKGTLRTAHIGPKITDGSLSQRWAGSWNKGATGDYNIAFGGKVTQFATGVSRKYKASQFATVKLTMGVGAVKKKTGEVAAIAELPGGYGMVGAPAYQALPGVRTVRLATSDKARWSLMFAQVGGKDKEGYLNYEAGYFLGNPATYKGGKSYTKTVNTGVFGPRLTGYDGVYRDGNEISGLLPLLADGKGNDGAPQFSSVATVLHRNGKKYAQIEDPLQGWDYFTVPAGSADYKLSSSVKHSAKIGALSTRVDVSFSFRSKKAFAKLPASTVRFTPALTTDGRAKAGKTISVPVKVQGSAAGKNLKSLATYVSYNGGKTWKKVTVKKGKIAVKNPAKGKAISFAANITDKKGNKSTVRIYNAYLGK